MAFDRLALSVRVWIRTLWRLESQRESAISTLSSHWNGRVSWGGGCHPGSFGVLRSPSESFECGGCHPGSLGVLRSPSEPFGFLRSPSGSFGALKPSESFGALRSALITWQLGATPGPSPHTPHHNPTLGVPQKQLQPSYTTKRR